MKTTVTKEAEIHYLAFCIQSTMNRIEQMNKAHQRRVDHEEGHIRYLEQRIKDLQRSIAMSGTLEVEKTPVEIEHGNNRGDETD